MAYTRVSSGMLHSDKALLALLLLRIYLRCGTNESNYESHFDHLILKSDLLLSETSKNFYEKASCLKIGSLGQEQIVSLLNLAKSLPDFKDCVKKAQECAELSYWYDSDKPEGHVPVLWEDSDNLSRILEFKAI